MGRKKRRMQQLEHTVTLIQKRWGPRAIHRGKRTKVTADLPVLSTGFPNVDRALGIGGFPRGRISELVASGTAGQATLAAKTLVQAQRVGQQIVYVDVNQTVDLDFLARCGVHLDSLVVLRPFGFRHALEMTDDLIREGGAGTVVFDRLHPMVFGTGALHTLERALREWNALLNRSSCTLLFLTETILLDYYPVDLALPYFASVRLAFEWQNWLYRRRRVSGFVAKVTVLKNKLGPSGQSLPIRVSFNNHIHGDGDE